FARGGDRRLLDRDALAREPQHLELLRQRLRRRELLIAQRGAGVVLGDIRRHDALLTLKLIEERIRKREREPPRVRERVVAEAEGGIDPASRARVARRDRRQVGRARRATRLARGEKVAA